jgi:predicted methyltransferase
MSNATFTRRSRSLPSMLAAVSALALLAACSQEPPVPAAEVPAAEAPAAEAPAPVAEAAIPDYVSAAVNDPMRPAEQRENDALRLPAETVAFSGMVPGMVVVDYRPGGGYYTRIFSKVVGPAGKVYVSDSAERIAENAERDDAVEAIAADPNYSNVVVSHPPFAAMEQIGEPVDIVWTSANYHDMVNAVTSEGMRPFNEGVFRALKPGGLFFILDHASAPGAGYTQTDTLHRIDIEAVRAEMAAVGFVLDGESDILMRAADDRTTHSSFETSQFMLKFRKPE